MRLIDKFTIWFMIITSLVLVTGGWIVFTKVQYEIDREAIRRIKSTISIIGEQLEQGKSPDELKSQYVEISEMDRTEPEIRLNVYDTMAVYRPRMTALDRKLTVESSFHVGNKHYLVSMYDFVAEPDEIADGIINSLAWIFLILLAIVGATNLIISRRILAPFYRTLKVIEHFSLKKRAEIILPETRTREFQQLNYFVKKMTGKAQADYRALKEFTENASHELQTPLAIIRGKLELLLESQLSHEQGSQILSALNSIERLSKINHSLTLLNKLENQEFSTRETIDISQHLKNILTDLSELIEMKSISLQKEIASNVKLLIHPSLADVLLMNLFSNAIRHNFQHGKINIRLTQSMLQVETTGPAPEAPLEQAFERFNKTNKSNESIGLGLAIVKQICEVANLSIKYTFENGRHVIVVTFPMP